MGTGKENLMLQGRIYGLKGDVLKKRVDELLTAFQLQKDANRFVSNTGGMKRELDTSNGNHSSTKNCFFSMSQLQDWILKREKGCKVVD